LLQFNFLIADGHPKLVYAGNLIHRSAFHAATTGSHYLI
jgi:hypothetical protein